MTNEKAKDFFSAYYEGTLDSSLSVNFEQKLKLDGDLKHEYDEFVRTLDHLDLLKFEDIAVPADLHERISARLDRHIYDRKRVAGPVWASWLRGLAFAGVGAIAILGAILAVNSRGAVSESNFAPVATDRITYSVTNDQVSVKFAFSSPKTVIVTNEQGREVSRSTVGESTTRLSNDLRMPTMFGIQVGTSTSYVALPGTVRLTSPKGEGTVIDLAKAIAGFYRVPVTVNTPLPNERATWNFGSADVVGESSKALTQGYSVTLLNNGILEIKK